MKAKKLCLVAGIVCSLFAPSVRHGDNKPVVQEYYGTSSLADNGARLSVLGKAHAGEAWYPCAVVQTSAAWGNGYIRLTHDAPDPCFSQQWFKLGDSRDKKMWALVARAKQNGGRVTVLAAIGRGVYPMIYEMRLMHR